MLYPIWGYVLIRGCNLMLYPIWGYRQNLRVPIDQLEEQMQKVNDEIQKSAMEYARLTNLLLPEIAMETATAAARRTMGSIESPLDYGASVQIKMPLAADSLHMDAQVRGSWGKGETESYSRHPPIKKDKKTSPHLMPFLLPDITGGLNPTHLPP